MKASKVSAFVVLTCASAVALAQTPSTGKTRQQVQQELMQAQHDGIVPVSKHDYPPSPARIARNKELHALTKHAGEQMPVQDHHDNLASR
ncbi:DUF4148 domain-containing protein [Caballeronia sp. DA-9]|uniref:DUF4148 domain-containing protein n=1 Tax=Caballeronia sp. DA-9 TaxID=3436237 RepID=UPI003F668B50